MYPPEYTKIYPVAMAFFKIFQASVFLFSLFTLPSAAQKEPILLPKSKGPYAVAQSQHKLVDANRIDRYDPEGGLRNVMISLFHPVPKESCEETCTIPSFNPKTAEVTNTFATTGFGVPENEIERFQIELCCQPCDSAVGNATSFPLILFSPGLQSSRQLYNAQLMDIASEGYVVVSMDHTFEAFVVEYPDGTYTLGLPSEYWNPTIPGRLEDGFAERVADVKFLLNQLGDMDVVQTLLPQAEEPFNVSHAAMTGHSFGGALTLAVMSQDDRIIAGMNQDGRQLGLVNPITKPAVLFGRGDPNPHNRTNDESWPDTWDNYLLGWKREIGLLDAGHLDYGDFPVMAKFADWPVNEAGREQLGFIDGERAYEAVSAYVKAFMDFAVKGKEEAEALFVEGGVKEWPEVVVEVE